MAANVAKEDTEATPGKKGPGLIVWIIVAAVSAGAGFAVPTIMNRRAAHGSEVGAEVSAGAKPSGEVKKVVIPFGSIPVNLNEPRMNAFLKVKINLLVAESDEKKVSALVEEKRLLLQSWLLSHISEKTSASVRGEAGQKMLQREILEKFNSILFDDGYDRIYEILFEEFLVSYA